MNFVLRSYINLAEATDDWHIAKVWFRSRSRNGFHGQYMDEFAVNTTYILVALNSKTFTIRSRFSDVVLYLHYGYSFRSLGWIWIKVFPLWSFSSFVANLVNMLIKFHINTRVSYLSCRSFLMISLIWPEWIHLNLTHTLHAFI